MAGLTSKSKGRAAFGSTHLPKKGFGLGAWGLGFGGWRFRVSNNNMVFGVFGLGAFPLSGRIYYAHMAPPLQGVRGGGMGLALKPLFEDIHPARLKRPSFKKT